MIGKKKKSIKKEFSAQGYFPVGWALLLLGDEQPERREREKEHRLRLALRFSERSRAREIYYPNCKGVVYESGKEKGKEKKTKFGLSPLSPLPRPALIQPFESTDRQTVWLELLPELWSDCVFPFNPAHGKASFAALLLASPHPNPFSLTFV